MKHELYLLSLLHHIPEQRIQARYKELLASSKGMEKILNVAESLTGNGGQPSKWLRSPLECLLDNHPRHFLLPHLTDVKVSGFPVENSSGDEQAENLWKAFADDFLRLPTNTPVSVLAETTLHLLHKYAANLPNPVGAAAEISWYDFAKSLAGITIALQEWVNEENTTDLKETDKPFILIGGDLSGIQRYITAIVSKGAAKNLKGRSFYLHMLTESVVTLLLHKLNLGRANVVYASGGSFYILAPNTKSCKAEFEKAAREIAGKIYATHKNALALVLDYTEVSAGELSEANKCFDRLMDQLEGKKRRKNPDIIQSEFRAFFEEGIDAGGSRRRDSISGEEINDKEENFYREDKEKTVGYKWQKAGSEMPPPGSGNDILKMTTFEQIALGRQLRKLEYWAFSLKKPDKESKSDDPEYFDPCELGVYHYLKHTQDIKQATILAINDTKNFLPAKANPENVYGFNFYGGDEAPIYKGRDGREEILQFSMMTLHDKSDPSEIENESERQTSFGYFRRLGILRMDVDNLGTIFRDGIPGNRSTFAFYSALSRSLDWFFKGYLNTIWGNEKFKNRSQIIYSGGDDLFIIGRWDLMVQFAQTIASRFRHFTGENPHLGISGGIAIVTHKFPIIKASVLAGTAEKKAKNHHYGKEEKEKKNALTLMGEPLHWEALSDDGRPNSEYAIVEHLKNKIRELGKTDTCLERGFCQRIQAYQAMKEEMEKRPKGAYERSGSKYRWKWMIAYDFARLKTRIKSKENPEAFQFLDDLQKWTFTGHFQDRPLSNLSIEYDFMDMLNLAARWAELEYRSQEKND